MRKSMPSTGGTGPTGPRCQLENDALDVCVKEIDGNFAEIMPRLMEK
jgi:hypothetical protein